MVLTSVLEEYWKYQNETEAHFIYYIYQTQHIFI